MMCEYVKFKDFEKLDLRVGKIEAVKQHPKADKLYILKVDFGKSESDRQIVAGLKPYFKENELIGKKVVVCVNLEPRELRGVESQGMILCAEDDSGNVVLLGPLSDVDEGSKVC